MILIRIGLFRKGGIMKQLYQKLGFNEAELSTGSHVCSFYDSRNEYISTCSSFLSAGLMNKERCVVVCSDETEFDLIASLSAEISTTQALKTGQLIFDRADEVRGNPNINVDMIYDYFVDHAKLLIRPEWETIRFCTDVNFFLDSLVSKTDWMRLEVRISKIVRELPMLLLCEIDLRAVSAEFFLDILRTHQFVVVDGAFFENQFILEPTSFMDMLERRQPRAS